MRRPKTFILLALIIIILIAMLFALSGLQQSLFRLFWTIFQLKYLIYFMFGLIVGYYSAYLREHLHNITAKKQNKENR